MKEIYVCEKCGAQFDGYHDAYMCEESHTYLDGVWCDYQPELNKRAKWAANEAAPVSVIMSAEVLNHETREYERTFYTYKRGAKLSGKEVAEITAEFEARKAKEKADYEEWQRRREEEKARKEAEAASADGAA